MKILLDDDCIKIRANLVSDFEKRVEYIEEATIGTTKEEAEIIARTQSESYEIKLESDFKLGHDLPMQHMEITNIQDLGLTLDKLYGIANELSPDNALIGNYLEYTNNFIRIEKENKDYKFSIINNEKGVVKFFNDMNKLFQYVMEHSKDIIFDMQYKIKNEKTI